MALIDNEEAARRLARVILSDIELYRRERPDEGQSLESQVEEGSRLFGARVTPALHPLFAEVLANRRTRNENTPLVQLLTSEAPASDAQAASAERAPPAQPEKTPGPIPSTHIPTPHRTPSPAPRPSQARGTETRNNVRRIAVQKKSVPEVATAATELTPAPNFSLPVDEAPAAPIALSLPVDEAPAAPIALSLPVDEAPAAPIALSLPVDAPSAVAIARTSIAPPPTVAPSAAADIAPIPVLTSRVSPARWLALAGATAATVALLYRFLP